MDDLSTDAGRRKLLAAALATNDPVQIVAAVSAIIREVGTSHVARGANKTRQTLHQAFHEGGNPSVDTLFSVLAGIGLKLTVAA